jgi:hypothetical protein
MSRSDEFINTIISKTNSGKIKWQGYSAVIGNTRLSLSVEDDRPELTVYTDEATRTFHGPLVNELMTEVDGLAVSDDPDLLDDLSKL